MNEHIKTNFIPLLSLSSSFVLSAMFTEPGLGVAYSGVQGQLRSPSTDTHNVESINNI